MSKLLSRGAGALLSLVLAGALFASDDVRAQGTPKLQDRLGTPTQPLDPPQKPKRDRLKLLGDLYERLTAAASQESASLIAEAIEKLWLRSGSDTVDLLMVRAEKLLRAEELDTALEILDSVVEIAPDYAEGWNQRAAVHFLKGEYRRSLEDLRHVLVLDPRHFKAISGLALILQKLGDKRAALKAFRKVLTIHPHLSDAQQAERELTREVEGQGI